MKTFKGVFLALFGTFIEYYDYALYGFAAPILAQHFFPKNDPTVLLLQAYGIFFAGSCSKPLGSLLFGYIGDRLGRAFALKISIFGIAIPTVMIGLLPDYQTLGWIATAMLIFCRVLQGIFVSGESDSARVFIFESLPKKYRCLSNSLAYCLCMLGIYWASFSLNTIFSENSAENSNILNTKPLFFFTFLPFEISREPWRLAFLMAGIFGILLFILRQSLKETQPFLYGLNERNKLTRKHNLIQKNKKTVFNFFSFLKISNKSAVLLTLLMTGAAGGQYHFYFVFLPTYLNSILNPIEPSLPSIPQTGHSHLLFLFAIFLPLAGFLADKLSNRFSLISLLKTSAVIILGLAVIHILFIQQGHLPYSVMVLTAVALSFAQANTFVAILNQFNVMERCRGTSLGHALGSLIFSGSTPFISLWIWNITRMSAAPFYYFLILCSISYGALIFLERKQRISKTLTPNLALPKPYLSQ